MGRFARYLGITALALGLAGSIGFLNKKRTERLEDKIIFVSNQDKTPEIYMMDSNGNNQKRLTYNDMYELFLDICPNGKKIIFASEDDKTYNIYTINFNGSNLIKLTNGIGSCNSPSWSPDGKKIAFSLFSNHKEEIYVMDSNGKNLTRVTNNEFIDGIPSWSPDGKEIAFNSLREGSWGIYIMDSNGNNQKRLVDKISEYSPASWSPNGEEIAFASKKDGNNELYIINKDGSGLKRLTYNPASDSFPDWFSNGNEIVFISDRDGNYELYKIDVNTLKEKRLTNNNGFNLFPKVNKNYTSQNKVFLEELINPNNPESSIIVKGDIIKDYDEVFSFKGQELKYNVILFKEAATNTNTNNIGGWWDDRTNTAFINLTKIEDNAETIYTIGLMSDFQNKSFIDLMTKELYEQIIKETRNRSREEFIKKFLDVVIESTIKHERIHHFYPYTKSFKESFREENETYLYEVAEDPKFNSWVFYTTYIKGSNAKFYKIFEEKGFTKGRLMQMKPEERSELAEKILFNEI